MRQTQALLGKFPKKTKIFPVGMVFFADSYYNKIQKIGEERL